MKQLRRRQFLYLAAGVAALPAIPARSPTSMPPQHKTAIPQCFITAPRQTPHGVRTRIINMSKAELVPYARTLHAS
jgi:predicted transglutaminase-like cysteine proteinase